MTAALAVARLEKEWLMIKCAVLSAALLLCAFGASAAPPVAGAAYGPELQGFAYTYPVKEFAFASQGEPLQMAYMDVAPEKPNGRVAVLLHGKNFCAATWEETIKGFERSWLSRDRAGSDRLLQIEQTGALSV